MTSREFSNDEIFYTHPDRPLGCGETITVTCHDCVNPYARYVYVLISGNQQLLLICELEVYTEGDYHSWIFLTYAVGGHADGNLKQIMCTFHHCALCHEVSVMVSQYRVRWWHGTVLATSHYLFQWWPWFRYMCSTWTWCVNDVLRNHVLCSNRFSKWTNITPSGSCFRHIGSSAADVLVKFQSDRTTLNTIFAAFRLCEILSDIETGSSKWPMKIYVYCWHYVVLCYGSTNRFYPYIWVLFHGHWNKQTIDPVVMN